MFIKILDGGTKYIKYLGFYDDSARRATARRKYQHCLRHYKINNNNDSVYRINQITSPTMRGTMKQNITFKVTIKHKTMRRRRSSAQNCELLGPSSISYHEAPAFARYT